MADLCERNFYNFFVVVWQWQLIACFYDVSGTPVGGLCCYWVLYK